MPIGICQECGDYYQKPKDPKKDKGICQDCFAEALCNIIVIREGYKLDDKGKAVKEDNDE